MNSLHALVTKAEVKVMLRLKLNPLWLFLPKVMIPHVTSAARAHPSSIHLKPKYTAEVRKILVQAFTEEFTNDLAPKEELTKLGEKLNDITQENEELTKLNEELKQHNEELTKKIKKLEKQVKTLMEEARKNDESKLADLSIKPTNRKPPFPVY